MSKLIKTGEQCFKTQIVGLFYAQSENLLKILPLHTPLDLIPEPSNQYDAKAIRVEYGLKKLGYIPQKQTLIIHKLWMAQKTLVGYFDGFHFKRINENYEVTPARADIIISIS